MSTSYVAAWAKSAQAIRDQYFKERDVLWEQYMKAGKTDAAYRDYVQADTKAWGRRNDALAALRAEVQP